MKEERKGGVRNHGCGEKNKRTHHHQTPTQGNERHGVADSSSRAAGSWVIRSILRTYNHIILMIIPRRAGGGGRLCFSVMGSLVSKDLNQGLSKNAAEMFLSPKNIISRIC